MLKTRVLLTDVTNLSDARYAVGMGVELIGFNLNPAHPAYVTPEQAREIGSWLAGVQLLGELGPEAEIAGEEYPIELTATTRPDLLPRLKNPVLIVNEPAAGREAAAHACHFIILRWSGSDLPGEQVAAWCRQFTVFVDADFGQIDVIDMLDRIQPAGIVLHGSREEKPGLSRYEGIAEVLEALEDD